MLAEFVRNIVLSYFTVPARVSVSVYYVTISDKFCNSFKKCLSGNNTYVLTICV